MQFSEIRKTVIDIATTIVAATPWVLQAEDIIHLSNGEVSIISGILGVAGWIAHYFTPNVTDDPAVAATSSVRLRTKKPVTGHTAPRKV